MNTSFMRRAIEEAKKGEGFVHPNPLVGAVIVKDNEVIATGYHHKYGELHAERDCLKNAKDNNIDVTGCDMYVTLEPCCHTGKQPPCTQALIESGIKNVFIGSRDPNSLVNGKGVKQLLDAGINVVQDVLKDECDALNKVFFHYITTKKPYVTLKYAITADGKTSTRTGKSKWITNEESRKNVHESRACSMAIMTGINTVIADDPLLNCRLDDGKEHRQPIRIVCDSHVRLSTQSNLVKTAKDIPVIDVCLENLTEQEIARKIELEKCGVEVICVCEKNGHIDLRVLLSLLGERGIDSIFVESGGILNAALLYPEDGESLVDEVQVYIGAKLFGNVDEVDDAVKLEKPVVSTFGNDSMICYKVK